MIILGLDVSSISTGWSIVSTEPSAKNSLKLDNFGIIHNNSSMSVIQRLYFQSNEIKKILEKFRPDEIAMEETVFVHGPKIMKTLSRFSGIALLQCYTYNKKEVCLYEPARWKKSLNIKGNALKAEVQLKICSEFNLLNIEIINKYQQEIEKIKNSIDEFKNIAKKQKLEKIIIKKQVANLAKEFDKISINIYTDCGINNDIADSIGIALCLSKQK